MDIVPLMSEKQWKFLYTRLTLLYLLVKKMKLEKICCPGCGGTPTKDEVSLELFNCNNCGSLLTTGENGFLKEKTDDISPKSAPETTRRDIKDLTVGESGYTLPWALRIDTNMDASLNPVYPS